MAAHAVGHDEESSLRIGLVKEVVFIAGADHPDVRARGVDELH
jgi:hypothetical protein